MKEQQNQALIFLHIPKAAGSTLATIIRGQYQASSIYEQYPANIRHSGASLTASQSAHQRVSKLKSLPLAKREKIAALMGHDGFGLHELLPRPATYITMLRDPIDRVISHYYYVLRNPNNYLYEIVTSKQMSLEEYATSNLSPELDNGQTKYLTGFQTPYLAWGEYANTILETAKNNLLHHFAVVGLTERFDDSLVLIQRAFGWKTPFYVKTNVTRHRLPKQDLPAHVVDVIRKRNELDIELYAYVQILFEEQIRLYGSTFHRNKKKFSLMNKAYGQYYYAINNPVLRQIRKIKRKFRQKKGAPGLRRNE